MREEFQPGLRLVFGFLIFGLDCIALNRACVGELGCISYSIVSKFALVLIDRFVQTHAHILIYFNFEIKNNIIGFFLEASNIKSSFGP